MADPNETESKNSASEENPAASLFGKGKCSLILEDDPTSAELVRSLLTNCGFDVLQAKNGKDAWDKIRPESKPDIIISDFLMPEIDGFQFLKGLKKDPQMQKTPIIFLSERKNIEDSILVCGGDAFFSKPLDTKKFLETIKTLLERPPAPDDSAKPDPAA